MSKQRKDIWLADPPDNSSVEIDIVPEDFSGNGFCMLCGGAIELDFTCSRCGADYWSAIKRNKDKARS